MSLARRRAPKLATKSLTVSAVCWVGTCVRKATRAGAQLRKRCVMETGSMTRISTAPAVAVLRAENLGRAEKFYTDVLGFTKDNAQSAQGVAIFSAGMGSQFSIYERPGMGAPENTSLAFPVSAGDFDTVMADLRNHGVKFEEYD